MAELRELRSALTRAGVTRDIKVEAFFGQGFTSMGDIEIITTLSQLLQTLKSISFGGLLQTGNISFSITALVSIEALWFWINASRRSNQYLTGGGFNQDQRNEFHDIYRDVQERVEAKRDNRWILPKWESKTILLKWDDFLLNVMDNEKLTADKYTPIQYLLCKQEALTTTADLPYGLIRL